MRVMCYATCSHWDRWGEPTASSRSSTWRLAFFQWAHGVRGLSGETLDLTPESGQTRPSTGTFFIRSACTARQQTCGHSCYVLINSLRDPPTITARHRGQEELKQQSWEHIGAFSAGSSICLRVVQIVVQARLPREHRAVTSFTSCGPEQDDEQKRTRYFTILTYECDIQDIIHV